MGSCTCTHVCITPYSHTCAHISKVSYLQEFQGAKMSFAASEFHWHISCLPKSIPVAEKEAKSLGWSPDSRDLASRCAHRVRGRLKWQASGLQELAKPDSPSRRWTWASLQPKVFPPHTPICRSQLLLSPSVAWEPWTKACCSWGLKLSSPLPGWVLIIFCPRKARGEAPRCWFW